MNFKVAVILSMAVVFASGTSACSADAPGIAAIDVRSGAEGLGAKSDETVKRLGLKLARIIAKTHA